MLCTADLRAAQHSNLKGILPQETKMHCPNCNRKMKSTPGELFYCVPCDRHYDSEPEEGGPAYNDPAKTAESKEGFEQRQRRARARR